MESKIQKNSPVSMYDIKENFLGGDPDPHGKGRMNKAMGCEVNKINRKGEEVWRGEKRNRRGGDHNALSFKLKMWLYAN